jgi:tetratricopeptide (TPR) repeat protein
VRAIRTVDPDVTGDEIADAVWLARHMRGTGHPASSSKVDRPRHDETDRIDPAQANSAPQPADHRVELPLGATDSAAIRLSGHSLLADEPGVRIRSPGVPAITGELTICRALRPLQRRLPSATLTRPDEPSTAEWIAETGLWIPASLPVFERWLDVALVVDDSVSMAVWAQTIRELRTLLQQTGAFRDVRVWQLDGDLRHGERLSISGGLRKDTVGRDPREIVDPAGRRLVIIASDCVGRAWSGGAMADALSVWASSGPTAIVQMLPQRMWMDCGPTFTPVRLRSPYPGVPNGQLQVRSRNDDADLTFAGLPIPVLELEARWLRPWASLVAGTAGRWTNGIALFTGLLGIPADDGPESTVEPRERLRRFRAHASHEAYQLSVCLAAAPLSLPVMRLVQGAMLPASRPSHLAEVFLSGLLCRAGPDNGNGSLPPDEIEYDFRPGVRAELLSELARQDALQVLSKVSGFVSARLGSPLDFRALLTAELSEPVPDLSPPFAHVTYGVLRMLGGRYAEAADRLSRIDTTLDRTSEAVQVPVGSADDDSYDTAESRADSRFKDTVNRGEHEARRGLPAIMRGVPPRNPRFIGRDDLLRRLRDQLVDSSARTALLPHALHGLGGVGKTQLAVEYVYRYAGDYDLVWWVAAEDPAQVRASFVELGDAIGLPETPDVKRTVGAVLDALRAGTTYRRWLLVFDNADQPDDLAPYLPYPTGHVLITSRNVAWSEMARTVEVDVLSRQESISLLRERVQDISDIDADRLADRLGDLPLALEQAGAWQAETGMSVAEYLRLFEEEFDQLTAEPPAGYPASVGATYRVALDRLREQTPSASRLLDICAFLGPAPVPVGLLWDGRHANLPPPLDRTLRDAVSFRRSVREIGRYALARVDTTDDSITVHRLVQLVVRAQLDTTERDETQRLAQQILASANPGEPDKAQNWPRLSELSPHILPSGLIHTEDIESRRVILDQIRYRWIRGDYQSSRELGEQTVKVWSTRWGDDDELLLIARRDLAIAMRSLGEYQQARELAGDTLTRIRQVFGDDHEHTLYTADSLSWDLRINGNFREAMRIDEDNFARCHRVLGDDDPFTLKVANNLAVDRRWLGDFAGARQADDDSVQRRRRVYGDEDQNTQLAVGSLARDLYELGEYAEGLRLQETALPIQRRILGHVHGEVLVETRNQVILLRKTGQRARARNLAEELFQTYERRFGIHHEHTLAAMLSYGNALRDTGELGAARELGADALTNYRDLFGENHAATLSCANDLAITLRHLGEVDSALELNEATLSKFRRVLGDDHPFTLCCATNTGNDLAVLLRQDAAGELSDDTLTRSRRVRGDDHPYTFACMLNAALDRQAAGDADGAAPLLGQAIAGFERRLGRRHPETVAASAHRRADCDLEPPGT